MHQFQFAGYYAAEIRGFYAEEGLDVEIFEGTPEKPPLNRVLAGHADFGVSAADLLLARMQDKPVLACLAVFQHSPYALISLQDAHLSRPSDLIDKTVMLSGDQGAAQLHALLRREGLPKNRINFVPHSWDLGDLISGKVDVMTGYTTAEPFQLQARGFKPNVIRTSDYGVDFYGDTLFTTEAFAGNRRSDVAAMMRATSRGWKYAMQHEDELIDYILTLPGITERGIKRANLEFEAAEMQNLILPELVEIGHMNSGRWAQIADAYVTAGIATSPKEEDWIDNFIFDPETHPLDLHDWIFMLSCIAAGGLIVLFWNLLLCKKVEERTEKMLRGERKLHAILNNSNNVLALLSNDGRLVELNRRALEFSGADRSGVLGVDFSDSPLWETSPAISSEISRGIESIQNGGRGIRLETELATSGGKVRTLDFSLRPVSRADNTLEFIVAEGIDITEQKAVAFDLETSRSSLSSLVEHTRGLIWSVDREGILISSNTPFRQALWRRTGKTIAEGDSVYDFFEESERRQWEVYFERALQGDRFTAEFTVPDPTGRQVHEASFHSISQDKQIAGVTVFEFDISERKRSAEILQQTAELNQLLLDSALDAVIGVNSEGAVVHWNSQSVDVFGYPEKEAIGSPVKKMFPQLDDFFDAVKEESKELRFEMKAFRSDGSSFPAEVSLSILPTGHQVAFNFFVRDVTEHHRLEEKLRQSQKMEAIGQLAGGVAHDFNNLLTVIQGNASIVRDEWEEHVKSSNGSRNNSQCLHAVTEITNASERAASLTGQLLAFSRQQAIQFKTLQVNESTESVISMLTRLIGEDIQLRTELCPEPTFIRADKGMLEQVILNLAVNGRDAMPDGGLLTIKTSVVELQRNSEALPRSVEPGEFVRIDIKDTGKGIPAEDLPHIFEPFFTTKEVGKGTGLGLATVFGIMDQHHGWLDVDSKVGKGTIFTVWLPTTNVVPDSPVQALKPAGDERPASRGGETILLVEDEDGLRLVAKKILTKHGYHVIEAHSGQQALGVWEQFGANVDLLLTDIVMPEGMSGHELSVRLQEEKPSLKVIYSSGYTAEIFRGNAVFPEDVSFIGKPYLPEHLLAEVRAVLDGVALSA
ncbi:ABC transporter substrate-binding protein [Verrucomicrobiales bacterium BCK34]|nr:ABC transporter substrate-binding protein [Verrucomicrobiales bacterium BCK34]